MITRGKLAIALAVVAGIVLVLSVYLDSWQVYVVGSCIALSAYYLKWPVRRMRRK